MNIQSKYNYVQVYNVWVNGRDADDLDQHYPIDTNINRDWHSDFKKATEDYFNAKSLKMCDELVYQDYQVSLFSIDINIEAFEEMFGLKWDLTDDNVLEMIPYYKDYDFNTVAERIAKF